MADGLERMPALEEALARHASAHHPVSDCPLMPKQSIELLPSGAAVLSAIFETVRAARVHLHFEYYIFEDIHWEGESLVDLLIGKLQQGVSVAISYDGAGSLSTPGAVFQRLEAAGAALIEFRPFNPFARRFSLRLNDRDHRKLLVADGEVGFVGGVNLSRVYTNPRSAGAPADASQAFWYDAAVRVRGSSVAEMQKLFFHGWRRNGGRRLPEHDYFPAARSWDGDAVRVDGSAPRERRQLYFESLYAALGAARERIILSTGYFVPTRKTWQAIAAAAKRGVSIDLVLAGYSDLPSCVRAARALYGPLLKHGVRIHELHDGMLHGKLATIDGVWTAIGSSNLDRRSYVFNNEIDAVVLGPEMARAVEGLLGEWKAQARTVTLEAWTGRSVYERAQEGVARIWSGYM